MNAFCFLTTIIQPKYIHDLLTSAKTRKLDHLRAEDKMMQLEREAEGDEFKDREAFVTQAYKDQMAEVRKAEEEEKKRDGELILLPTFIVLIRALHRVAEEERWCILGYGALLS
jgi:hypothetical protein